MYRFIYCMDIKALIILVAVLSGLFGVLYHRTEKYRLCKAVVLVMLLAFSYAIVYTTLLTRSVHENAEEISLVPFASYIEVINGGTKELLRSNFMNVLLFYPSGMLASVVLPKKCNPVFKVIAVTLFFALFSFGIEYTQYTYALGKAEVDDVIHNTLGAMLGSVVGAIINKRKK